MNPHEDAARTRKAYALADALDGAGYVVGDEISDVSWHLASRVAGVNPPSQLTKAFVGHILAARARVRERSVDAIFEGL